MRKIALGNVIMFYRITEIFAERRNKNIMRTLVTGLSIATLIAYGYAIAGIGGFLLGKGRIDFITWGLTCGSICAALALYIWKKHPEAFYEIDAIEESEGKNK